MAVKLRCKCSRSSLLATITGLAPAIPRQVQFDRALVGTWHADWQQKWIAVNTQREAAEVEWRELVQQGVTPRFDTWSCRCRKCGDEVRGRTHELVTIVAQCATAGVRSVRLDEALAGVRDIDNASN